MLKGLSQRHKEIVLFWIFFSFLLNCNVKWFRYCTQTIDRISICKINLDFILYVFVLLACLGHGLMCFVLHCCLPSLPLPTSHSGQRYQETTSGGGSNPSQPPSCRQAGCWIHLCVARGGRAGLEAAAWNIDEREFHLDYHQLQNRWYYVSGPQPTCPSCVLSFEPHWLPYGFLLFFPPPLSVHTCCCWICFETSGIYRDPSWWCLSD